MDPSLIEIFVFENMTLLEQLEKTLLAGEKNATLSKDQIDEVFRVMHTIKGSASMMEFSNLAHYAHALEDLFDYIRSNSIDEAMWEPVFDIVLEGIDFIKGEIIKVQDGEPVSTDITELYNRARAQLDALKGGVAAQAAEASAPAAASSGSADDGDSGDSEGEFFHVQVEFQAGCGMETIRAMSIVNSLKGLYSKLDTVPESLDNNVDKEIVENGFEMFIQTTMSRDELSAKVGEAILVQSIEIKSISADDAHILQGEKVIANAAKKPAAAPAAPAPAAAKKPAAEPAPAARDTADKAVKQSFISINVNKVDRLMNLVGEIVTTESMVTKNPDLAGLKLENFSKQARQLRKLTNELQDVVMSIRMVPISAAFNKMQRIVRDMSKKIGKEADLVIIGETTELDKNVIDCLGDPLMHLVRNSMDHGLESPEDRIARGKPARGTITLEAYNTGGDVIITVSDDGRGLDKSAIVAKAIERGLTTKSEDELTDTEAYGFILEPGFSTNENITEYSGRGVGMDVVHKNIELINGTITLESTPGEGMTNKIHIPLTLSIVEGMVVSVGTEQYIIPILNIRESFEAKNQKIFSDPNGMDMVIIRGECYRILRLSQLFNIAGCAADYAEGIMVMIETEMGSCCLFVDKLIGEQQAVIKPIPEYISKTIGRVRGISSCTVLGDGSISMILDTNALTNIR